MGTIDWMIADIQNLDRKSRKVVEIHKGKHISQSVAMFYLPKKYGGRGFKSVEDTYKASKKKLRWHITLTFKNEASTLIPTLQKQKEFQIDFCRGNKVRKRTL